MFLQVFNCQYNYLEYGNIAAINSQSICPKYVFDFGTIIKL